MKNKIKSIHLMFLHAIAFIFIISAMQACKSNSSSPQQPAQVQSGVNDSLIASHDSLLAQNNAIRLQIDELTTKNSILDSQARLKDANIAKLTSKIKHLENSNKSLFHELKKDKAFIASLKDQLSDKTREYATKLGLLENDKSSLASERDALLDKYNKLKELGSVLHASNIRLMAIHLRHHGTRERNTSRARKVDELKVCFDIDENRIAEDGTKKLYLVIKDPSGNLVSDPSIGGATTTSQGNALNYSISKEVPLKQDEPVKDVTVDWKQDTDYKKGVYSIAIYNGGYKIGGGNVALN